MTEDAPSRLADRRRDLIARDIRRVALTLFAERGFAAVSVQEIADAAGMSARTFFRYFASKDDILLDYERHLQARLQAALRARPPGEGAVTALRNAYIATSTVAPEEHDAVVARARMLAAVPALRARANGERAHGSRDVAGLLADRMGLDDGRTVGRDAADQRALVIAAAMSAAAVTAWDCWLEAGATDDPSADIAAALDLLVHGLAELDHIRPAAAATR
jgi:AcrR family transcriptional regulator